MKSAQAFISLILILTVTTACNLSAPQPTNQPASAPPQPTSAPAGSSSLDAFVASLPDWTEVSPEQPENDGLPTGAAPVASEETAASGDLYACTTTQYSITKNPDEIALYNPDASVLWPGALIRGGSHLTVGSLE
ncbi:MAG TPA: hypothetical protein VI547_09305, partial [Anaerolineales bacterium]|nr:hypothetical protein [Anaerolineales bacterium]